MFLVLIKKIKHMGNFSEVDEDIEKMVNDEFAKTGLKDYNIGLKILSVSNAKSVVTVKKANDIESYFLSNDNPMIFAFVYSEAFDRLDAEDQQRLIEMEFSTVHFNVDKEKLIIENKPCSKVINMNRKYEGEDFVTLLERSYEIINEIKQERKEMK